MPAYPGRRIAVGIISVLSTDIVTTTYAATTNFRALAVEFLCCGSNSATSAGAGATILWSQGISARDGTRYCVFGRSEDGAATTIDDNGISNAAVVGLISGSGTDNGRLDIDTWNDTGFVAIVDTVFNQSVKVLWWAHGGSHLRYATCGIFSEPATANLDTTITGPTQKCNALVLISLSSGTDPPSVAVDVRTQYGVAVENADGTVTNAVCAYGSEDAAAATVARNYCRIGESIANFINGSTSMNSRGFVVKFNGDGSFVVNYPEIGASTRDVCYLALAGGQNAIGSCTTLTNTSSTIAADATLPFTPSGAVFVGAQQAAFPAADTVNDDGITSIGVVGSTLLLNRAMARRNEHAADPTQTSYAIDYEDIWIGLAADGTGTIDGTMRLNRFVANNIECQMSTAAAAGTKVWFWAVGNDKADKNCQEIIG